MADTPNSIESLMKDGSMGLADDYAMRKRLEYFIKDLNLTAEGGAQLIPLTEVDYLRYKFDFYALLAQHNVNPEFFWIVMRANGLHCSTDFDERVKVLVLPNTNAIGVIQGTLKSNSRMRARKNNA